MASRSGARRAALRILFAADSTGVPATSLLEEPNAGYERQKASAADAAFTRELVTGVEEHAAEIDQLLEEFSRDWTVARMPSVDRSILRLACVEIVFRSDVPVAVAIDEAVEEAKELSTADSAAFVNGVLGAVARARRGAQGELPD